LYFRFLSPHGKERRKQFFGSSITCGTAIAASLFHQLKQYPFPRSLRPFFLVSTTKVR
jgi:hypothetical protein